MNENKNNKIIEEGTCPFCGSADLDYYDSDYDCLGCRVDRCHCFTCDRDFKEYYKVIYDGCSYVTDDGIYHETNGEGVEIYTAIETETP